MDVIILETLGVDIFGTQSFILFDQETADENKTYFLAHQCSSLEE